MSLYQAPNCPQLRESHTAMVIVIGMNSCRPQYLITKIVLQILNPTQTKKQRGAHISRNRRKYSSISMQTLTVALTLTQSPSPKPYPNPPLTLNHPDLAASYT